MAEGFDLGNQLPELVRQICVSYWADPRTHHIDKRFLPSRTQIVRALELLIELIYPGYWGRQNLTQYNVSYHVGELLPRIGEILNREIYHAFCYQDEMQGRSPVGGADCREKARRLVLRFLEQLPAVREKLGGDVQAAYDGDPAAVDTSEVILSYPGVLAVTIYRLAHELHQLEVPWIPRVMTEWAHAQTGIDIHPGARIGRNFFIDHGTGVVIGETTEIGESVKLYQGVTLGALSFPKDERGRLLRGFKRHPTVKEGATLYANAIVLGGETIIGQSAVVGGSVFLTSSIPDGCTVTIKTPELSVRPGKNQSHHTLEPLSLDFQI
ncbi:MAG: hypothetical protein HJJLKODD_02957 [Phycisphaerae bacterium]|nr:hypothetical protein [Phycisphaerae bacterium]